METKTKNLEQNITDGNKFNEWKTEKNELENFYDNIATGVKSLLNWSGKVRVIKIRNSQVYN